jgi:hypothetical protein
MPFSPLSKNEGGEGKGPLKRTWVVLLTPLDGDVLRVGEMCSTNAIKTWARSWSLLD